MANPTAYVSKFKNFNTDGTQVTAIIKNTVALVIQALVCIDQSLGHMDFASSSPGQIPCGMLRNSPQGNADELTGNGTRTALAQGSLIINNISVTGVSAVTDVGSPIYAVDGQTMSLSNANSGLPIGYVVRWRSTTYCDVYLYSYQESLDRLALGGGDSTVDEIISLGTIHTSILEGTSAVDIMKYTTTKKMNIVSLFAYPKAIDSGLIAGDQDLNLEIGTTNLTGGVLTLAYTDADAIGDVGTKISSTAITAANTASPGDVVTLEMAASGTGFTASKHGIFDIFIGVKYLAG